MSGSEESRPLSGGVKCLHFDLTGGASGDMLLGALIDLGAELDWLNEQVARLPLPGVKIRAGAGKRHGLTGLLVEVEAAGGQPARNWSEIRRLLTAAPIPARARAIALDAFGRLARAEGKIHGVAEDDVHFHEVGAADSIADVVGTALAVVRLGVEEITSSEPLLGRGFVDCQHGRLPLPAPATLEILRGAPARQLDLPGERTTPTGAALLRALVSRFGPMPGMTIERIGCGLGHRDDAEIPNLARAILGYREATPHERVAVIETNIDDMNPELYDHLLDRLFAAGALDVFITPILMKKNRPAQLLTVLAPPERKLEAALIVLAETPTLGVRFSEQERFCLRREIRSVQTVFGPLRVKLAYTPQGKVRASPEYEDVKRAANEFKAPAQEVYAAALQAALKALEIEQS